MGVLGQKIDGLRQHLLGRIHHRQVGLVGTLRFAHVHDFHQAVDIGQLHIALAVGIGIAGIILALEVALVGHRPARFDQRRTQLAVEARRDGGDLAAIGIAVLGGRGGIGVGDILRDDLHALGLSAHAGRGNRHRLGEIHFQFPSFFNGRSGLRRRS
ncbi:MAG TPA: hypothetical protein VG821_07880 [Rhizomicrobium sp.]|nr:hypothetical protein [Rhizomicrobium sp.]